MAQFLGVGVSNRIQIEIVAQEASLTEADVLALIPANKLQEIKAKDPNPFFKAWVLLHEGLSSPTRPETGIKKSIRWTAETVKRAHLKVAAWARQALPFFKSHSDHEVIGETVAATQITRNGKAASAIVGYFPEAFREFASRLKQISMEAIWDVTQGREEDRADDIYLLNGVAGVPDHQAPGFPEAQELIAVSAVRYGERTMAEERPPAPTNAADVMQVDLSSYHACAEFIRRAKRIHGIFPHQIFTREELAGRLRRQKDGKERYEDGDKDVMELINGHLELAERQQAETVKPLADKLAEQERRLRAVDASPKIEKLATEKKLPAFVAAEAKDRLAGLDLKDGETLDAALERVLQESHEYAKGLAARGVIIPGISEGVPSATPTKDSPLPGDTLPPGGAGGAAGATDPSAGMPSWAPKELAI